MVENEQWQTPLRYVTKALKRGPTRPARRTGSSIGAKCVFLKPRQ